MNDFNNTDIQDNFYNEQPLLVPGDDIIEMNTAFDFDNFQVVRREFFAHMCEPSITFNMCKFYVNAACLSKFPSTECVQVLINQEKKILALRPCSESAKDSFVWCTVSKGKRKPKQTTCKLFFAKIFSLMNWNPDYRYKITGKLLRSNSGYLLVFDMNSTEVYQRIFQDGQRPKTSRTPVFPEEWKDQFGLSVKEHKQSMQINIFDGYAIYSIKDSTEIATEAGVSEQEESK